MPRLKITLAYEGTRYAGWQLQTSMAGATPCFSGGPPTVQGALEESIMRILGRRIPVHGAGRTDSGVHAEGQVCHADIPDSARHIIWRKALNAKLPFDIRVVDAEWAPLSFHARKSARAKRYAYSIWTHRERALPRVQAFVWSAPPLDLERLLPALPLLEGRHDFAAFQNSGASLAKTVRTLHSVTCRRGMVASLVCPPEWPVLTLVFEGDGFLKQMVRNLAGLLVWIGQGKIAASDVPALLTAGERKLLPSPSAPAQGLTLLEVLY